MSNDTNNLDDLLDDDTSRSLSRLGYIFPENVDDFKRLDERDKDVKMIQPDRIMDPFEFLGKRAFRKIAREIGEQTQNEYFQSFAQAAREGKEISEEIKKKMIEDKQNSKNKNKG